MFENQQTLKDRLMEINESIELIWDWSDGMTSSHEFMLSPNRVMAFNACVMRLQVIGEHVGRLLKTNPEILDKYPQIPWHAIYGMRSLISHEYANINENIVVDVITNELKPLKCVIDNMLNDIQ